MTVATGNFAELLWPGLRTIFGETYGRYKSVYPQVFKVERSELAFEKDQGVTGLPLAGIKEQGAPAPYVDPQQGYQKEYKHITYGIGSSVTREMYDDDQYRYINRIPVMLAESLRQTEETTHANTFNNGFTTEVSADQQSVFNTLHPNVADGGFQSNQPATSADLTQTSLEQAIIDIRGWTDDQGLQISVSPRLLVVPRQLRFVAQKILMTSGEVGSADNTMNPMNDVMKYVDWTYLTDPDAWFICTDVTQSGLVSFTRRAADIDRDNEFDTQNLKFLTTKRWSRGVTDWRAAYGSPGA